MKKEIRELVFETNSSSVHSLSIKGDYDGNVVGAFPDTVECLLGEYGWGYDRLYYVYNKLCYAMAMVLYTEYPDFRYCDQDFVIDENVLQELEGFKLIKKTVESKGCKELKVVIKENSCYKYGYIDHQSYEDYNNLKDFLDDWNITLDRFLFDDGVSVIIDNDNH